MTTIASKSTITSSTGSATPGAKSLVSHKNLRSAKRLTVAPPSLDATPEEAEARKLEAEEMLRRAMAMYKVRAWLRRIQRLRERRALAAAEAEAPVQPAEVEVTVLRE